MLQRWLYHAVEDERLMAEWKRRFPEDVQEMRAFYVEHKPVRKASRVARRKDKAELRAFILAQEAGPQTIGDNDDMWQDVRVLLHAGVRHHCVCRIGLERLEE
jgi:hypothetical protein